jgi:hypothetical protein
MDRFRQTDGKATGWDRSIVSVGLVESRKGSSATGGEHRLDAGHDQPPDAVAHGV